VSKEGVALDYPKAALSFIFGDKYERV